MSFDGAILSKYARTVDPDNLSKAIYFEHTSKTLTIFDKYPKARFHFLLIPRQLPGVRSIQNLHSLQSFFNSPEVGRKEALELLNDLKREAEHAKKLIEEEMLNFYGFVTNIYMGFHAVQSMDHIHLHIISEDFVSPGLKTKKHYNSFNPQLGFFLHLDEVIGWFSKENDDAQLKSLTRLDKTYYEPKLQEPLKCFRCSKVLKNMPQLKEHLHEHLKLLEKNGKTKVHLVKKRERDTYEENDQKLKDQPKAVKEQEKVVNNKDIVRDMDEETSKELSDSNSTPENSQQRKKQRT